MTGLPRGKFGGVIELDSKERAAILAFVDDAEEQAGFSEKDFPEEIEAMMGHMENDKAHSEGRMDHDHSADN
jgi:antitoxin component HigA of HigAB toxin-antitoxin module